jgi:malate dehydrogenase (oxaloacetate-decarboxylating)
VVGRPLSELSVVINGAGAAGRAIAYLLSCKDEEADRCVPVGRIRVCDSKGILWPERPGNDPSKEEIAQTTNPEGDRGSLADALVGTDVFIGVSRGDLLKADDVRTMAPNSIVLAMANPTPEIMPDEAKRGGAAIVGTGRSDFANQVNNVLAFPGLFRGALEARATRFTASMKLAAVDAIVSCVDEPTPGRILPTPFDRSVSVRVAAAVAEAARRAGVCH